MLKRWRVEPGEWVVIGGLVIATALVFGAVVWQMIYNIPGSDYNVHIAFAVRLQEQFRFSQVHILLQLLIIGLTVLFPITPHLAALLVIVIFYVFTALVFYALFRGAVGRASWRSWVLMAMLSLALLLVTPVNYQTFSERNFYFGYVGINVLHSPTMVLLKPLALLLFAFAITILNQRLRLNALSVATGFLLVLLSLLAKPNFVLVLLPTLMIVIAYRLVRRDRAGLTSLIVTLVIPMLVLLAAQYLLMYTYIDGGGASIIFAPLATVTLYEPTPALLPLKFALSILFPMVVYGCYWRHARRELTLNVAWLAFIVGAAQMYLFAESGARLGDANFWWSAQIALFVLFGFSALFWWKHFRDQPDWRGWLCLGMLGLHLGSGLVFYRLEFFTTSLMTWW